MDNGAKPPECGTWGNPAFTWVLSCPHGSFSPEGQLRGRGRLLNPQGPDRPEAPLTGSRVRVPDLPRCPHRRILAASGASSPARGRSGGGVGAAGRATDAGLLWYCDLRSPWVQDGHPQPPSPSPLPLCPDPLHRHRSPTGAVHPTRGTGCLFIVSAPPSSLSALCSPPTVSQENLHLSLDGPALTVSPRGDPEKQMLEICHVMGGPPLRPRCWQPPQGPHRTPSHNSPQSLSQKHPEPLHKPGGELGSSLVLTPGALSFLVFTSVWPPWMLNTKLSSARSSSLPSTLVVGNHFPFPLAGCGGVVRAAWGARGTSWPGILQSSLFLLAHHSSWWLCHQP